MRLQVRFHIARYLINVIPLSCGPYNTLMPRKTRRYYLPSTNESVTQGKLKRLTIAQQIEVTRHWFSDRYETPDELPYDSSEGGFQWIWGGPYDAHDALQNEFGGTIADDVIEKVASELADITPEWSGKPSDGDFYDDYLAELIESGTDPFLTLIASLGEIESAAKLKATEKERTTLHKLLFANIVTALETFLGDLFMKTLSQSEHYLEDFVRKTRQFQETNIRLSEIFDRFRKLTPKFGRLCLPTTGTSSTFPPKCINVPSTSSFPKYPTRSGTVFATGTTSRTVMASRRMEFRAHGGYRRFSPSMK